METINDVLNFLNQIELFRIISGLDYITFNIIRKILIDEFNNINDDKLIEILKNLDDIYINYIKMDVDFDKTLIKLLRDNIFEIYEQKMSNEKNTSKNQKH